MFQIYMKDRVIEICESSYKEVRRHVRKIKNSYVIIFFFLSYDKT